MIGGDAGDPRDFLTTERMKSLLITAGVLKAGHWKEFSKEAVAALAADVRSLAWRHRHPTQAAPQLQSLHDEDGVAAAEVLKDSLRARRETWNCFLQVNQDRAHDPHNQALARGCAEVITKLDTAIAAIDDVAEFLVPKSRPIPKTGWQDYAIETAKAFLSWRRIVQPEKVMGISAEGPVSVYVSAVMPFITGETVTIQKVGSFLKKHSDEMRSDYDDETI